MLELTIGSGSDALLPSQESEFVIVIDCKTIQAAQQYYYDIAKKMKFPKPPLVQGSTVSANPSAKGR